jgi:acyl-CoA dehydrogenase
MSTSSLLIETVERICSDHCSKDALDAAERGEYPYALWMVLVENGLHDLCVAELGLEPTDWYSVFRAAARHALPVPLAETVLGKAWLADAGIDSANKLVSLGLAKGDDVVQVPWGRQADIILALQPRDFDGLAEPGRNIQVMVCDATAKQHGNNVAGEARDALIGVQVTHSFDRAGGFEELALVRTVQMVGALETVLAMSLTYVNEREQFGRAISKFQAIQHNMAVLAAEVAAAIRAADSAVAALGSDRFVADLAAAKARVGEAAGVVAEMAHQVHGAMGFTYEHRLHHFTRRLWAWRDEYGSESHWQQVLGRSLVAGGADALWPFVATRG